MLTIQINTFANNPLPEPFYSAEQAHDLKAVPGRYVVVEHKLPDGGSLQERTTHRDLKKNSKEDNENTSIKKCQI